MPPDAFRSDPDHAALVIIDVQNDFCHPDGALGSLGADTSAAVEMVPRLRLLVDAAHTTSVPVIFVRTEHSASTDSVAWLARFDADFRPGRTGLVCREGTWGSEFYGLEPGAGDKVVVKSRYSAFVGTNLNIVLRTLGVQSVLFAGVATETCVESSVRDGLFNEFYVSMVEDCSASYDQASHDASVKGVARHFGTIVRSDDVRSRWGA